MKGNTTASQHKLDVIDNGLLSAFKLWCVGRKIYDGYRWAEQTSEALFQLCGTLRLIAVADASQDNVVSQYFSSCQLLFSRVEDVVRDVEKQLTLVKLEDGQGRLVLSAEEKKNWPLSRKQYRRDIWTPLTTLVQACRKHLLNIQVDVFSQSKIK
jgi:hypothetical protein